jgi:DNA repair exonuclease SbcCD nuclease subunit
MKKFFHISDVHLGGRSKFVPGLMNKQLEILEKIFSQAVEQKITEIVIAGDLFDSPQITSSVIEELKNLIQKFKDINFISISGTAGHDGLDNERSVYNRTIFRSFPENFIILDRIKEKIFTANDMTFYGAASGQAGDIQTKYHILIFHGAPNDLDICLTALPGKKFDYIAMGHYHSFEVFKKNNIRTAYSGTVLAFEEPKGRSGEGDSSYAEVTLSGSGVEIVKKTSSEIKIIKKFIQSEKDIMNLKDSINSSSYLHLSGNEIYQEKAEEILKAAAASFKYNPIKLKEIPAVLTNSIKEIIDEHLKEDLPWNLIHETALRLISGEEGSDFLKPEKYFNQNKLIS